MDGFKAQSNAVRVERIIRSEFNCERFSLGGIANSDTIRRIGGFWYSLGVVFAKYYCNVPESYQKEIDNFLNKNHFFSTESLDNILEQDFEVAFNEFNELLEKIKSVKI